MPQKSKINLFRNGRFLGVRHRSTIEALVARDLVELEFNRKGYVVAAHEKRTAVCPIAAPVRPDTPANKIPTATRYSFEDDTVTGRPWDLRRLDGRNFGVDYAPSDVQPLFTHVVRSCLR